MLPGVCDINIELSRSDWITPTAQDHLSRIIRRSEIANIEREWKFWVSQGPFGWESRRDRVRKDWSTLRRRDDTKSSKIASDLGFRPANLRDSTRFTGSYRSFILVPRREFSDSRYYRRNSTFTISQISFALVAIHLPSNLQHLCRSTIGSATFSTRLSAMSLPRQLDKTTFPFPSQILLLNSCTSPAPRQTGHSFTRHARLAAIQLLQRSTLLLRRTENSRSSFS